MLSLQFCAFLSSRQNIAILVGNFYRICSLASCHITCRKPFSALVSPNQNRQFVQEIKICGVDHAVQFKKILQLNNDEIWFRFHDMETKEWIQVLDIFRFKMERSYSAGYMCQQQNEPPYIIADRPRVWFLFGDFPDCVTIGGRRFGGR